MSNTLLAPLAPLRAHAGKRRTNGLDEATLRTIATMSAAEYFYAGSALDLEKIYKSLHSRLALETRETEVTALFAAAAAALVLVAGLLSILWFNRLL